MRWIPIFTLIGIVLWSPPEISAKVERFIDKEGTLHISNEAQAEPGKPGGVQAPAPIGTPPPRIFPPSSPRATVHPPQVMPPPTEPPEMSGNQAQPPAPESGGEAQPAPVVPPAQAAPEQQE